MCRDDIVDKGPMKAPSVDGGVGYVDCGFDPVLVASDTVCPIHFDSVSDENLGLWKRVNGYVRRGSKQEESWMGTHLSGY